MTRKDTRGGARPGAGRKKENPALVAARNPRVGRRLMRESASRPAIDLEAILRARLFDADLPPEATRLDWLCYHSVSKERLAAGWQVLRDEILSARIPVFPGTRPTCWWEFEAPRQSLGAFPGCYYDGKFAEPRLRLGGKGTPCFEVLNYVPEYDCGLPKRWVDDWSIDYYTGKRRDVHGNPIGEKFVGTEFPAQRFDRNDPPRFESEAAYLKRLGLLAPGEAKLLTPNDFKPELLPECYWPKEDE